MGHPELSKKKVEKDKKKYDAEESCKKCKHNEEELKSLQGLVFREGVKNIQRGGSLKSAGEVRKTLTPLPPPLKLSATLKTPPKFFYDMGGPCTTWTPLKTRQKKVEPP